MGSLRISLTSPATLEHLKFNIRFLGFHRAFNFNIFYDKLRDVWTHLNSISSHPTGSRLQRVEINIYYTFQNDNEVQFHEHDENKVVKAVLDGLPILRTKGILFVETIVRK
jgi:hypothetical protein